MSDLNKFIEWSRNNPRCSVNIEIGGQKKEDTGKVKKIWVYNFALETGQHVSSVEEIDIETEYKKDMERKKREVDKYFQGTGVI